MADLIISRGHSLGQEEAKKRIAHSIEQTAKSFGLHCQWHGYHCHFRGPAKGHIIIADDSIKMKARLGFFAKFMKSSIQKEINEMLDQALG